MRRMNLLAVLFPIVVASIIGETRAQQTIVPKEKRVDLNAPLISPESLKSERYLHEESAQRRTLDEIESGISSGDGSLIARHLGPQVFLNLRGSESGYYSANQASYVLQNFFSLRRPISFTFTSHGDMTSNPFATGRGQFSSRGVRESLQIFVSLALSEGRWVITEFNAY